MNGLIYNQIMSTLIFNLPPTFALFRKRVENLTNHCPFLDENQIKTFIWEGLTDEEIYEMDFVARDEIAKDLK